MSGGHLWDSHGGFHGEGRVVSFDEPAPTVRVAGGAQASQLELHEAQDGQRLTPAERDRLAELEAVVRRGLRAFVGVGIALTEIRDARLYRGTHGTFEAYLGERWDMSRRRGYQLVEAAAVCTTVHTAGLLPPENERQARELVPLLGDPDLLPATWGRLCRGDFGRVTAKTIRGAVAVVRDRAFPAVDASLETDHACPRCGYEWSGCQRPPGYPGGPR